MSRTIPLDANTFTVLARAYRRTWRLPMCTCRTDGTVARTIGGAIDGRSEAWRAVRELAIAESLRWGDATVNYAPDGQLIWAAPLMHNNELRGGVVTGIPEDKLFADDSAAPSIDVRRACSDLRRLLEQHNLTNSALLEMRRTAYLHEQQRAEAIHEVKLTPHYDLRRVVWQEEPELIAAIRRGDRGEARATLNRILVGVLHHAGDRFALVKSFCMELVASVSRTAVEVGGDPEQVLGANFATLSQLAAINTMEQLSPWLHGTLERVMDTISQRRLSTLDVMLAGAMGYLREHFAEDIGRDDVARVAHLSPPHFSRLFHKHTGRNFTEVLARMRVNRAAELLTRTDKSIGLIAAECGFADQSYFTKTFRRHTGQTPLDYRRGQTHMSP